MQQEFLRQLTEQIPQQELIQVFEVLKRMEIEIYRKSGEKFVLLTDIREWTEKSYGNDSTQPLCEAAKQMQALYVCAADREEAVKELERAGLSRWVCTDKGPVREKSLVEQAEEEYYRKRKIGMIECLVVLAAAMVYYLIKMRMG